MSPPPGVSVFESAERRDEREALCVGCFGVTYHLCVDAHALRDCHDAWGGVGGAVDFRLYVGMFKSINLFKHSLVGTQLNVERSFLSRHFDNVIIRYANLFQR